MCARIYMYIIHAHMENVCMYVCMYSDDDDDVSRRVSEYRLPTPHARAQLPDELFLSDGMRVERENSSECVRVYARGVHNRDGTEYIVHRCLFVCLFDLMPPNPSHSCTSKRTDRQTYRQTSKQTTNKQTNQKNKKTQSYVQSNKETNKQTNSLTNKQTS